MDSRPLENTPDKGLRKLKGTRISMKEMLDKSKGIHQLIELLRGRGEYNAVLDLIEESGTGLFERLADVSVQFDEVNQQRDKVQYNSYRGRRAYYDATDKVIHIDVNASYVGGDASSVIMHELMHAVTLNLLKSNPT